MHSSRQDSRSIRSEQAVFLGLDVGTTSVKAGLVDAAGRGLAQASQEYPTYPLGNARVEQSAEDWWSAATDAVCMLTGKYPDLAVRIAGISISCQAPTLLPIDRDGKPLGRGMIWMDQRAEDICRDLLLPHETYINTFSGNRLNPYYVLPKLLWQKKHQPEIYEKAWKYLQINGWIVYCLTGCCSIDLSSAALTQTLNVHTQQTEEGVFDLFDIDADKWPRVYACDEVVATVTTAAAQLWGIPTGIPVMAGCIDGASSPLGLDVVRPGEIFEMSGQSSGIGVILSQPEFHPNLCLMKHAVSDLWLQKGSMSCSGGSLKWFRDNIDGRPGLNFDVYNDLAEQSAPGANGLIFLPYLCGERAPLWDRNLRGIFFGLGTDTTKADMVRAIMEGSAFALRTILDEFHDPAIHSKVILGTGGGYHSQIWSQIKSDILNCAIRVRQADFDAALRGNALLVMQGLGYPLPPLCEDESGVKMYTPSAQVRDMYEERYQYYCKIFRANQSLFAQNGV